MAPSGPQVHHDHDAHCVDITTTVDHMTGSPRGEPAEGRMLGLVIKGVIVAAIGAAIAVVYAWVDSVTNGQSLWDAVSRPQFSVIVGVMAVVVLIIVIDRGYESDRTPKSADRRALETVGWSLLVALVIGILLAWVKGIPTMSMLTSWEFLIPSGIAVTVAGLESYRRSEKESGDKEPQASPEVHEPGQDA
jgi:hypothetical protein